MSEPNPPNSLASLEEIIAREFPKLEAVALALSEIHERKLYLKAYGSFGRYLQERWGWSRTRGYQLLHFARLKSMSTAVDTSGPTNERQARRLDAQGKRRSADQDDPILRTMAYVARVFERLPGSEQESLVYHVRALLLELQTRQVDENGCPPR